MPRRLAVRVLSLALGLGLGLSPTLVRAEGAAPLSLRMRVAPEAEDSPSEPRDYSGPTAIRDEPGRDAEWRSPEGEEQDPVEPADEEVAEPAADPAPVADEPAAVTGAVPPPSSIRDVPEHVDVAIGLGPQAPGTREEKALLEALGAGLAASSDPTTEIRRMRPGMGVRRICRERRDDLVVMIGYIADRPDPVVLAHDCALDRALGVRAADAAADPGLADALWQEHHELMRAGARERRRLSLGPRARGGIIAGAAIVVVGVAVGVLVANALRDESVVITVRP